jgi:hypothetical protein
MRRRRWFAGDVSDQGMGRSLLADEPTEGVTHVPGLICHLCTGSIPLRNQNIALF